MGTGKVVPKVLLNVDIVEISAGLLASEEVALDSELVRFPVMRLVVSC